MLNVRFVYSLKERERDLLLALYGMFWYVFASHSEGYVFYAPNIGAIKHPRTVCFCFLFIPLLL
jgi:hypothetical protein